MADSDAWPSRELFEVISAVGRQLPVAHAERLGRALCEVASPDEAAWVAYLIPASSFAAQAERLLSAWRAAPAVTGAALAMSVTAAAHAHSNARLRGNLELVVSGPASDAIHARRTEQVLLQLISEARDELLLITFALEMHQELGQALEGAESRGVRITVLAEDPIDNSGFRGDPATVIAGTKVGRLRWPRDKRPAGGAALHAKVVVVDRSTTLVTSANLTRRASGDNFEAGILIRGDDTGRRIVEHVDELLRAGTLLRA